MARIVVLDDEALLLKTLKRMLEQQGHEVWTGCSLADVDEHLRPGRFDVLLSDIVMPQQTGLDILRAVADRGCAEPVVLITGEPNVQTASEAVRLGAFDYVAKPLTKDKLVEVVTRALRHVQLVRDRDQARRNEMQLLQQLAKVGESAALLAHEIRTPITALNQAMRAVADKLGVEHADVLREFNERLVYLERLMQRTLSFAKPADLEIESLPLATLFSRVQQQLGDGANGRLQIAENGATVVHADPVRMLEILSNLVRNALEADDTSVVELSGGAEGDQVWIQVDDDGPGVPDAIRDELFELFRSSKHLGTGLGLAISKKLVEAHAGRIELVEGKRGGACFRIVLPSGKG